ncbi:MAG TPA: hypothetical protein VLD65_04415 [Anaerolineales bacterium]|nr:hypothetical protein [Anaerolineales bacterium]
MNTDTLPLPGVATNKKFQAELSALLKSTLLMFLLIFPITLMELILHEGGHALDHLAHGVPIEIFYVHPFSFNGYVRPFSDLNTVWRHASGVVISLSLSLIILLVYWRRRSISTLPFIMLFPWIALKAGFGVINLAFHSGDYYNIIKITNLPEGLFFGLGFLCFALGVFFLISLFPLLGLAPRDMKTLIVLPTSLLFWTSVSVMVAHLTVPGSPIDIQFQLKDEILASATSSIIVGVVLGLFIAMVYVTVYRKVYASLPVSLRIEKVSLGWRNMLKPALLFIFSLILGLTAIQ